MKIINNQDRMKLGEGRDTGMCFAFLKKNNDEEYETVIPITACKDFLNEVVFTENTGIPTSRYGLEYPTKLNIFIDSAFLAIKICKNKSNTWYSFSPSFEKDVEHLKNNYKNIQKFLEYFEDKLDLSARTVIHEANDDYFLVEAPLEWIYSTYMISLYTLLIRCTLTYNGTDNIEEFIKEYDYNTQDQGMLKQAYQKLLKIIETKVLPKQVFNEENARNNKWCPHNYGIIAYESNTEVAYA